MERLSERLWNLDAAAHLLRRAGFGVSAEEIFELAPLGVRSAVDRVVESILSAASPDLPEGVQPLPVPAFFGRMKDLGEDERRAMQREAQMEARRQTLELREWWLRLMADPVRGAREKLTLFWHGHFASGVRKVRGPHLMLRQNVLLRNMGAGSFVDLTKAVARDPAMLVYLDGARSRSGQPNENFARELMELFTLGEGVYTEVDIAEAARAFTGFRVIPLTGEVVFDPRLHDDGPKKLFGPGRVRSGDDVIDAIVARSECAGFMARKLWQFYVSDVADERGVRDLASILRSTEFAIDETLRRLFESRAFYAPEALRAKIKSPVEWLVGLSRTFGIDIAGRRSLQLLDRLGQSLFEPPNVRGWVGGRSWITPSTLLLRQNAAVEFLERALDPETCAAWAGDPSDGTAAIAERLIFRAFCGPVPEDETAGLVGIFSGMVQAGVDSAPKKFLLHLAKTPRFQLN